MGQPSLENQILAKEIMKNQIQFIIFSKQKEHDDQEVRNAQIYIENNYEHKLNIDEIANEVDVSRRNFLRRFK